MSFEMLKRAEYRQRFFGIWRFSSKSVRRKTTGMSFLPVLFGNNKVLELTFCLDASASLAQAAKRDKCAGHF